MKLRRHHGIIPMKLLIDRRMIPITMKTRVVQRTRVLILPSLMIHSTRTKKYAMRMKGTL